MIKLFLDFIKTMKAKRLLHQTSKQKEINELKHEVKQLQIQMKYIIKLLQEKNKQLQVMKK